MAAAINIVRVHNMFATACHRPDLYVDFLPNFLRNSDRFGWVHILTTVQQQLGMIDPQRPNPQAAIQPAYAGEILRLVIESSL
jgi:hypothetical protein